MLSSQYRSQSVFFTIHTPSRQSWRGRRILAWQQDCPKNPSPGQRQRSVQSVFSPLTRPAVNPAVATGLLHPIVLWQQDCSTQSCCGNRIAPPNPAVATGLPRCTTSSSGLELFFPEHRLVMELRHVVDADDEGQATRKECVSQLRVKDQVVAPSRTIVVHAAAGENVRRVSVDALVRQAGQSA